MRMMDGMNKGRMMKSMVRLLVHVLAAAMPLLSSCRHDVVVWPAETGTGGEARADAVRGFWLLNEGNMGSNKCTLDFYDYASGTYGRNVYGSANPTVVKLLGDVGNDLHVYGGRLWAVVNCSNKIEVMEAATARRIGQVDLANCRRLCFRGPYAYATSYAGPVQIRPDYEQRGLVVRIDTATLEKLDTCIVGFQPDGLDVVDGKIYVANSGGYMSPNYENTVSVVDMETFREERRIPVAVNLHHLLADGRGCLWVSSRGDYYGNPSALFCISDPGGEAVARRVLTPEGRDVVAGGMTLCGDSLYVVGSAFSYATMRREVNYAIVDTRSQEVVTSNFIADGTEQTIVEPYGIAVHPLTREILLTDARTHVNPGTLFCFSREGRLLWKQRTGDIPAHIAFLWN